MYTPFLKKRLYFEFSHRKKMWRSFLNNSISTQSFLKNWDSSILVSYKQVSYKKNACIQYKVRISKICQYVIKMNKVGLMKFVLHPGRVYKIQHIQSTGRCPSKYTVPSKYTNEVFANF